MSALGSREAGEDPAPEEQIADIREEWTAHDEEIARSKSARRIAHQPKPCTRVEKAMAPSMGVVVSDAVVERASVGSTSEQLSRGLGRQSLFMRERARDM